MKALILAAGKGTRLKHLTANTPKPMLPVGDKPLLEHIVLSLRRNGINEIAMNLHHAPEQITAYFGDGAKLGVQIHYSYEENLLGTAGAAKKLEFFLNEPFIVVYGDVFNNVDLGRLIHFHESQKRAFGCSFALSLSLYRVPNPSECGLVDLTTEGRILRFVEKPPADQVFTDLANAGIMLCEPKVFRYIPAATVYDFGHQVYPALLADHVPIFGLPLADNEFLIDIGTPTNYQRAQALASIAL